MDAMANIYWVRLDFYHINMYKYENLFKIKSHYINAFLWRYYVGARCIAIARAICANIYNS